MRKNINRAHCLFLVIIVAILFDLYVHYDNIQGYLVRLQASTSFDEAFANTDADADVNVNADANTDVDANVDAHAKLDADLNTDADAQHPPETGSASKATHRNRSKGPLTLRKTGIGACLLLKDDGDELVEWLAYHAHVLPLRYLIVAVDPTAATSPEEIFDRWRRRGMRIEVLDEHDFMPAGEKLAVKMRQHKPEKLLEKLGVWKESPADLPEHQEAVRLFQLHRVRQREFLQRCFLRHKNQQRSWVLAVDVDEYIVPNYPDGEYREQYLVKPEPENDVLGILDAERLSSIAKKRRALPRTFGGKGGTVADLIAATDPAMPPWSDEWCMPLPRLFFGAAESTPENIDAHVSPDMNVDAGSLNTLRYRTHAAKGAFLHNLYDKSLVDVSRLVHKRFNVLTEPSGNIHRVVKYCTLARPWRMKEHPVPKVGKKPPSITPFNVTLLRIHHYLGSWESYNARDDPRRSKKLYDELRDIDGGTDDDIRPWLSGFIEEVGRERAEELLAKPAWGL